MVAVTSNKPKVGIRNTRQRTAVIKLLEELDNFSSARELHRKLEERKASVGLTTVYRTLQALAEAGAVDVLNMASGESLYRVCDSDDHHHHLVCTECGATEEIDGGPIESWAKTIASKYGYQLTGHDAEIYGICTQCWEKSSKK